MSKEALNASLVVLRITIKSWSCEKVLSEAFCVHFMISETVYMQFLTFAF